MKSSYQYRFNLKRWVNLTLTPGPRQRAEGPLHTQISVFEMECILSNAKLAVGKFSMHPRQIALQFVEWFWSAIANICKMSILRVCRGPSALCRGPGRVALASQRFAKLTY